MVYDPFAPRCHGAWTTVRPPVLRGTPGQGRGSNVSRRAGRCFAESGSKPRGGGAKIRLFGFSQSIFRRFAHRNREKLRIYILFISVTRF